jgi:hypothetical protein
MMHDQTDGRQKKMEISNFPGQFSAEKVDSAIMSAPPPPPAPPKSFPYDHLFKLLMIGDAGVGKVRSSDLWD